MTTIRNFRLHCASKFTMNTMPCLTTIRYALVLRKIHFTLDDKFHFCGICIVMNIWTFDVTSVVSSVLLRKKRRFENIARCAISNYDIISEVNFVLLRRRQMFEKRAPHVAQHAIRTSEAFSEHEKHPLGVADLFFFNFSKQSSEHILKTLLFGPQV